MKSDFSVELAKGAPAVVGGAWYYLTLNQWVAAATGVYIVIQAAYLLRKWWREEKEYAIKLRKMMAGVDVPDSEQSA